MHQEGENIALESRIFKGGVTQTVTHCHRGVGGVKN